MAGELTPAQRDALKAELDAINAKLDSIDAMLRLLLKAKGIEPPAKPRKRRRLPA